MADDLLSVLDTIAFHASLSSIIQGTTEGQTIVFDQVDTNSGGGYYATNGVFTAPVAGHYVFTLTYEMWFHSTYTKDGALHIMKNNARQLTYRQPAQNGVLTDQLCRAIYCIHLSILPLQIPITIT